MTQQKRDQMRDLLRETVRDESRFDSALEALLQARFEADEVHVSEDLRARAQERIREVGLRSDRSTRTNGQLHGIALLVAAMKSPRSRIAFAVAATLVAVIAIFVLTRSGRQAPVVETTPTPRSHGPRQPEHGPSPEHPVVEKTPRSRREPSPRPRRSVVAMRGEIGEAGAVSGWPVQIAEGKRKPLKRGDTLYADSLLETGDTDKLVVKLADGSRMELGFNSRLRIPAGRGGRPEQLTLEEGQLWAVVQHDPSRPLAIVTPSATATVLGTEFGLIAQPRKTVLTVERGRVRFENRLGAVIAPTMTSSTATPDTRPTAPKAVASIQSFRMAGYVSDGRFFADTIVTRKPPLSANAAKAKLVLPLDRGPNADGAATPTVTDAVRDVVQETGTLVAQGKLDEAERAIRKALLSSDAAALHNNLGVLFDLRNEPGQAAREYGFAVRLDDKTALYHENLARTLTVIGNLRRALEEEQATVRLAPSWTFAKTSLAEGYTFVGDFASALKLAHEIAAGATGWHPVAGAANVLMRAASGVREESVDYRKLLAESERLFRRALELQPHQYDVLINFSGMLLTTGRPADAEPVARDAVATRPNEADGWTILGAVESRLGKPTEAEKAYKEALRVAPDDALVHYNLGELLVDQGRPDEALPHFEAAVKADPTDAESLAHIGDVYRQKKDFSKSKSFIDRALKLVPKSSTFTYDLGLMYVDQRDWKSAAKWFSDAVAYDANNYDAWVQLAQVRMFQNKNRESVAAYKRAIALVPNEWVLHAALASVQERLGMSAEAIAEYRQAARIAPREAMPKALLSVALSDSPSGGPEAVRMADEALRLDPALAEAHLAHGVALTKTNQPAAAEQELRAAIAADKTLGPAYERLIALVTPAEAEKLCRDWVAALPDDPLPHARLARLLANAHRIPQARAEADRAVRLDAESAAAWDARGWVAYRAGDAKGALPLLEKAVRLPAPREIRIRSLLDLAIVLDFLGRRSDAPERYKSVLQLDPNNAEAIAALRQR